MIESSSRYLGLDEDETLNDALSGISTIGVNLGEILGPLTSGLLNNFLGYSSAFLCLYGVSLIVLLIYVSVYCYYKKRNVEDMGIKTKLI